MIHEHRVRVRYAETDQMGVVYHANYLIYFETSRTALLRALGIDYKSMERQESSYLAVVDVACRYKASARFDDELIIRATLHPVRGSVVRFTYTIHRAGEPGELELLLTEGATTHIVVDRDLKRAPMPPTYAEAFRRAHIPVSSTET